MPRSPVTISPRRTHQLIARLVQAGRSTAEGMGELVEWLDAESRGRLRVDLSDLDMATDLTAMRGWLERLLARDPPPPTAGVLWFGLGSRMRLRVAGARAFDPDRMPGDWGWEAAWEPDQRAPSRALERISALAIASGGACDELEYVLGLGFASLAVRELVTALAPRLLVGVQSRAITVGFDEGDYIALGTLSPTGLSVLATEPSPPAALPPETALVQFDGAPGGWRLARKPPTVGRGMAMGFLFSGRPVAEGSPFVLELREEGEPYELGYGLLFEPVCVPRVGELFARLAPGCTQRLPAELEGHDVPLELLALLQRPDWKALYEEKQRRGVKLSQLALPMVFFSGTSSSPLAMRREVADALIANVPGVRLSPMRKPLMLAVR